MNDYYKYNVFKNMIPINTISIVLINDGLYKKKIKNELNLFNIIGENNLVSTKNNFYCATETMKNIENLCLPEIQEYKEYTY